MLRAFLLSALLVATACSDASDSPDLPSGTFQGEGDNTLTLEDPSWSLRTGRVLWSGTYRIVGDRLVLRTEGVEPPEGHASNCIGADESYIWAYEDPLLRLSFEGEPCNQNRWAVLTSFTWMGDRSPDEVN